MGGEDSKPQAGGASKVTVVGAGLVGATSAYTIMARGLASEIVLVDIDRERAQGEAMDLNHALSFAQPARIVAGDYEDAEGSDIAIIAAGAAQKAGESRLTLAGRNVEIVKDIVPRLEKAAPDAVLVVVSNPVDVLTYAAQEVSRYPHERVLGSGTILDTSRFRFELGRRSGVDPRNIHAYIIGEHGDSEVPVWSLANIAGIRLRDYCPVCGKDCSDAELDQLFENVKTAAYQIIQFKGATYYAIAMGVTRIVAAILRDEHSVMTVSTRIDGTCGVRDVCLSLPTVVWRGGVREVVPLPLSESEQAALEKSAQTLQEVLRSVGL
ncbi:MAG: L-lactate dehydrogenase [Candidatus Brocadiia bacterium]